MNFAIHRLLFYLIICTVTLCCSPVWSQSNEGKVFWFGFMEHRDVGENTMVAMVTSKFNTSGTISVPNIGWGQQFSVNANEVVIINLPPIVENLSSELKRTIGVKLLSADPVSVYIHQYHNARSEASVVLPINSLGNEYYVMTYRGITINGTIYPSEFLIVSPQDETNITITLSDESAGGKSAGTSFTVLLNAGETYQVQADLGSGDMTGTHITGDKNFALFGGNSWTEVPLGCSYRDNLLEQMFPISTWGKKFVTVPHDKVLYDIFRIMASEDVTTIEVYSSNNVQTYTLNAGEYIEYQKSTATYINANKPIQVAQFNIGSQCSGHSVGDPSMLLLNSVEQRRDTVTLFNSSFQEIEENFINIVVSTESLPFVTFDGQAIPSNAETGIVGLNGEYTYIRLQVGPGAHTIISQSCGVIASAYGYGQAESYSYGGGANFNSINVNPIPDGGCLNDTVFFNANLPEPRYSFFWDLGDGNTSTKSSFIHFYPNLGSYPVMLIINDQCLGTIDTLRKDLLISLRQAVDVEGPGLICEGESLELSATDLANATYEWLGPGEFYSESQFPVRTFSKPNHSGEYSAIGIVSGCATYPALVDVEVIPSPEPNLGPDTLFCNLDTMSFITPGQFAEYLWQDNSKGSSIQITNEGAYWVEVKDQYGCVATDTVILTQLCPTEVFVPNAFSPNSDGVNDYFEVFGHDIISMKLQVFDRWGNFIFSGNDQHESWDGTYNGNIVPSGVYVWILEIEGYHKNGEVYNDHITGSLTVIR